MSSILCPISPLLLVHSGAGIHVCVLYYLQHTAVELALARDLC